jgi:hypothetical protein
MAAGRRIAVMMILMGALALASCQSFEPDTPFGGHFSISAEPPPVLDASSLRVHVTYGGCGEAEFGLEQVVSRDLAVLRVQKASPDELCDMLLSHWLEFPLASAVRNAVEVRLVGPNTSVQLR